MIGHSERVSADAPLEEVHRRFSENGRDFLAVLDGDRLIGVCARREVAMQLGARYGFALFAQVPVKEHLMDSPLILSESTPLAKVLESISARPNDHFYDEVLLVDDSGRFLGLIFVHALVRHQTELLLGNIEALERSRLEIEQKNRAMEEDLMMAREVQVAMLRAGSEATSAGEAWVFNSHYRPAGGVSGDFFQLIRISECAAGVLVCDVMGHGVRAALITAMLRAFAEDLRPHARDPGAILTLLNQRLMAVLRQAGNLLFVTAAYAVVEMDFSTVRYGQAGHPTGFLRRASGGVERLPAEGEVAGPALGLIEDYTYVSGSQCFNRGDAVIQFTDGLFEVRDAQGEEWGQERLRDELARHRPGTCAELLPCIAAAASAFSAGAPFEDDVCIVALEAKSGSAQLRAETSLILSSPSS